MVESAVSNGRGLLRVVPNSVLAAQEQQAAQMRQDNIQAVGKLSEQATSDLAAYVLNQFEIAKRHRQGSTGWNDRLIAAMRMFKGEYDPEKLAAIKAFGGSEIYARIVAVKCRGATALLRDIYLSSERPWGVSPTPDPTLPEGIGEDIQTLLEVESMTAMMGGEPVTEESMAARRTALMNAAREAAIRKAEEEAEKAKQRLDDVLVEGGFYSALAEFLVDLPLFPFACIKGPVVRITPRLRWVNRKAVIENVPRMYWDRVSPFDLWWSPGVSNIEQADVFERHRLVRSDLNALLDLPGYDQDALRAALEEYGDKGYTLVNDTVDSVRADSENRENPAMNETGVIECLEFTGSVQGHMLQKFGVKGIKDAIRDYNATVFMVGRHVIKAHLTPSPRKRHPYYITSFEKVPGTVAGNGLPDIISDVQDVCNATLRSLVNNMSMASGPQVVVDDDRLADGEDGDSVYPWKRWHTVTAPGGSTGPAIQFSQPNMHAQELLVVYEKFTQIADEISAIPRYITGSERMGGAGRTASGLAMLMNNASKILQTVAANIDRDVFEPCLQALYDITMLTAPGDTSPGALRGDESIEVRGVNVAIQRETERQRQMEFLTNTNNPVDLSIIGPEGRAAVLRAVSKGIGLDGEKIVPTDADLQARQRAEAMKALLPAPPGAVAGPGGAPTPGAPAPANDMAMPGPGSPSPPAAPQGGGSDAARGPRTNLSQQTPQP